MFLVDIWEEVLRMGVVGCVFDGESEGVCDGNGGIGSRMVGNTVLG